MHNQNTTTVGRSGWSRRVRGTLLGAALLAGLTPFGSAPAAHAAGNARDVVYVESNDPAGNAILAYRRHADGSLTMLPGSPFATGGLGDSFATNLGPFDVDSCLITNPAHTLLFAVNGGSATIAVFAIADSGALTPVAGSPFPSGGAQPASMGLAGDLLCVVNKAENPGEMADSLPNTSTFRVRPDGALVPIPRSTVEEDQGADPSQALIAPGGSLLFGADFLGGALRSFAIAPTGRLIPRAFLAPPEFEFADSGAPALPLGLAVHPTLPLLYVGFVTINRIGVYRYDALGGLHYLRSVPDSGKGVCWILPNKKATRLYTSNTTDPSVSVYDLTQNPAEPIEIQKVNLVSAAGSNPGGYQIALDPSENFFHVVSQQFAATSTPQANALHVFAIGSDGKVTEVASSPTVLPVPTMTRPQGVVAF